MSDDKFSGFPEEITWVQPFRWGSLLVFDDEAEWELPQNLGNEPISSSRSCVAVQVLHSGDSDFPDDWPDDVDLPEEQVNVIVVFSASPPEAPVQFDGALSCPSRRLCVGDAENSRIVEAASENIRVQISLFPFEYAKTVILRFLPV